MTSEKKKKGGWVYFGESTRPDGTKKIYTGKTKRSPYKRWGEHMKAQKSSNNKTWTGRGTFFKPLGAIWSTNPDKAEKTIKKMSAAKKRSLGKLGARRYKNHKRQNG